ncbi:MAG: ABC transporter permease [Christensenellales bacterium]
MIDIVRMAVAGLWRRKLRTFLTVLGVIIGTASIVLMVALGIGNQEQFYEQIGRNAVLTQIDVYNYGMGPEGQATELNERMVAEVSAWAGVQSVTPVIEFPAYITTGRYSADYIYVYAVDPDAIKSMGFTTSEGRLMDSSGALEMVLGHNARQYFSSRRGEYKEEGPDIDWLNAKYKLKLGDRYTNEMSEEDPNMAKSKEYDMKIVGLLQPSESEESWSAYMSINAIKKLVKENKKMAEQLNINVSKFNRVIVRVEDMDTVAGVLQQLKDQGYQATSPTEWIEDMREELRRQQSQLAAIGVISLIVSAIGIANTMLTSIIERTREIGVMKVLGCKLGNINAIFLCEAAFIGLFGGLVGVMLSYLGSFILSSVAMDGGSLFGMWFGGNVRAVIPAWLGLGAIGFSMVIGVLSGLYPAWRAMRMSPLAAIRNE